MDYEINYNEQMLNYYPEVISAIREFRELIKTQSLQVEEMHDALTKILADAYVLDAGEERISQWESLLGITPLLQGEDTMETWLSDRRETILARLYNVEKLNSKTISDIVSIFTGGTATSRFENGTIYVVIDLPTGNKQYKFENVEQELRKKIPAHLMLSVSPSYFTWGEVFSKNATFGDILNNHNGWDDVLYRP
jgi:hypothetical protein